MLESYDIVHSFKDVDFLHDMERALREASLPGDGHLGLVPALGGLLVLRVGEHYEWYPQPLYLLSGQTVEGPLLLEVDKESRDEIERLWIPFVVFSNTENQEATKGGDETEVTISREGNFTESSVNVMEEINIFEGVDNRITFQQVYSKAFKCVYELQLYPFDTQVKLYDHKM